MDGYSSKAFLEEVVDDLVTEIVKGRAISEPSKEELRHIFVNRGFNVASAINLSDYPVLDKVIGLVSEYEIEERVSPVLFPEVIRYEESILQSGYTFLEHMLPRELVDASLSEMIIAYLTDVTKNKDSDILEEATIFNSDTAGYSPEQVSAALEAWFEHDTEAHCRNRLKGESKHTDYRISDFLDSGMLMKDAIELQSMLKPKDEELTDTIIDLIKNKPVLYEAITRLAKLKKTDKDDLTRIARQEKIIINDSQYQSLVKRTDRSRAADVLAQAILYPDYAKTLVEGLEGRLDDHRRNEDQHFLIMAQSRGIDIDQRGSDFEERTYAVVGNKFSENPYSMHSAELTDIIRTLFEKQYFRKPERALQKIADNLNIKMEASVEETLQSILGRVSEDQNSGLEASRLLREYLERKGNATYPHLAESQIQKLRNLNARLTGKSNGDNDFVFGLKISDKDPIKSLKIGNSGGACIGFYYDNPHGIEEMGQGTYGAPLMRGHFESLSSQFVEVVHKGETVGFYLLEAMLNQNGEMVLLSNGQYLTKHNPTVQQYSKEIDNAFLSYITEYAEKNCFKELRGMGKEIEGRYDATGSEIEFPPEMGVLERIGSYGYTDYSWDTDYAMSTVLLKRID